MAKVGVNTIAPGGLDLISWLLKGENAPNILRDVCLLIILANFVDKTLKGRSKKGSTHWCT